MKLLFFIIFCLFSLSSKNLEAAKIKYLIQHKAIAIDYDEDNIPDLIIKKEKGVTQHIFKNRSNELINISSVKIKNEFLKEFSRRKGKEWKLIRREKQVLLNDVYSLKTTELFQNGKNLVNKVLVKNIQYSDEYNLPRPSYPFKNEVLNDGTYEKILKASGDCYTLGLANLGKLTNLDMALDTITQTDIQIKDFIDIDSSCVNLCNENQDAIICGKKQAASCPINMPDFIATSVQEALECMGLVNPTLAAQLFGVVFSNQVKSPESANCPLISDSFTMTPSPGCKKIKFNCFDKTKDNTTFGSATNTCNSNWPTIDVRNVGCHDKKPTTEQTQKNTILHEMIHLLGYSHGEEPEMAYACATACSYNYFGTYDDYFSRDYGKEQGNEAARISANNICSKGSNYDGYKNDLKKVMIQYDSGKTLLEFRGLSVSPEDFIDSREVYNTFNNSLKGTNLDMCDDAFVGMAPTCEDNGGFYRSKFFNDIAEKRGGILLNMLMFSDPESQLIKQMKDFYFESTRPDWILPRDLTKRRPNGKIFIKKDPPRLDLFRNLNRIGSFIQNGDLHYALFKLDQLKNEIHLNILKSSDESGKSKKIRDNLKSGINSLIENLCIQNYDTLKNENPNTYAQSRQPKNYASYCKEVF